TALAAPTLAAVGLALVVAARRPALRWAALTAGGACAAAIAGAGADHPAQSAAGAAAAYALAVLLARWFGAGSGVSWVYAALAAGGASALRGALGAQTPADVVSGVLGALVATALAMVLYRAAHPAAEGGRQ